MAEHRPIDEINWSNIAIARFDLKKGETNSASLCYLLTPVIPLEEPLLQKELIGAVVRLERF
jgi:hypothetical protein